VCSELKSGTNTGLRDVDRLVEGYAALAFASAGLFSDADPEPVAAVAPARSLVASPHDDADRRSEIGS
jgi:hypothetical protein